MRTPAQWLRRMKRRKPGVYAYRTDRHLAPGREWGYVGKARDLDVRDRCHNGRCHHRSGCAPKPWLDLRPRRYAVELPWWLGFDFITLGLETLVILALRPRYNWQKNPRKDKVGPRTQATQRRLRDDLGQAAVMPDGRGVTQEQALRVLGTAFLLAGIVGWLVSR
jgi:hypothetical protein